MNTDAIRAWNFCLPSVICDVKTHLGSFWLFNTFFGLISTNFRHEKPCWLWKYKCIDFLLRSWISLKAWTCWNRREMDLIWNTYDSKERDLWQRLHWFSSLNHVFVWCLWLGFSLCRVRLFFRADVLVYLNINRLFQLHWPHFCLQIRRTNSDGFIFWP